VAQPAQMTRTNAAEKSVMRKHCQNFFRRRMLSVVVFMKAFYFTRSTLSTVRHSS
jgi:hypothetical protein